jgi:uncharacterized protein (TIGR00299 family) protein
LKIAYFDCFSGISGDMVLGALVDAGVDPDALSIELAKLKLDEFTLRFEKATKHSISGTHAVVETGDLIEDSHEHNDSPLELDAATHHHHTHDHGHDHAHHNHSHTHGPSRHLSDIFAILDNSDLEVVIIDRAKRIFDRLAAAEAKVHNTAKDQVHLHEVSGIDAIVDIVGSVAGLHLLEVDKIYASPLSLGGGFVRCAHGLMPVPAPGTMELLCGVPIRQTEIRKELVTPTGAAIITTLADGFGTMPEMTINQIGYGAGTRNLEEQPNLLRLCVGKKKTIEHDQVCVIETNLDDMSPEIAGYLMEQLFERGALDVFMTPIFMKKGRPATKLSVLSTPTLRDALSEMLLVETTTFGVRCYTVDRLKLTRDFVDIQTRWGTVRAKCGYLDNQLIKTVPEYEDCKRFAEQHGIPLRKVYEEAIRQIGE